MGMLSKLLLLPLTSPVVGSLWVGRQIAEAAEAQYNDPAALRAALNDAEKRLLDGTLSEDDYDVLETDLLVRLQAAAR